MKKAEIREKNRAKAINVMKKCMLKYGIVATTKDLVAQKSNLSMASIVRYFRTKDNMVLIVEDEIEKKFAKMYAPFINRSGKYKDMNAKELFLEFAKTTIDEFEKDPDMFALYDEIICYLFRHENEGKMLMEGLKDDMAVIRALKTIFNLGVEDGTLQTSWSVDEEIYFTMNLVTGTMQNVRYVVKMVGRDEVKAQKEHIARVFFGLYARYVYGVEKNAIEVVSYLSGGKYL